MVDTPETIRGGGVVCIEALHSLLDKNFKRQHLRVEERAPRSRRVVKERRQYRL